MTKMSFLEFPVQVAADGYGYDWDPSPATNAKMATLLTAEIKTRLGCSDPSLFLKDDGILIRADPAIYLPHDSSPHETGRSSPQQAKSSMPPGQPLSTGAFHYRYRASTNVCLNLLREQNVQARAVRTLATSAAHVRWAESGLEERGFQTSSAGPVMRVARTGWGGPRPV